MNIFGFCKTWTWARALVCFGIVPAIFLGILALATYAQEAPKYRVDPFWPQELPNNWIVGQIGGLAVDREDHIWVLQRPARSEEHTSELQSHLNIVCRLLLEKKKII